MGCASSLSSMGTTSASVVSRRILKRFNANGGVDGEIMKKITMMEFRKSPGAIIHEVYRHGEEFLITQHGRPVARLVPHETMTHIDKTGRIIGEIPITKGVRL